METDTLIRTFETPLGKMTAFSDGTALTGLFFIDQAHFPHALFKRGREAVLPVFDETERWLSAYYDGKIPDHMPKLSLKGSAYQLLVWEVLLTIPYGETISYQEAARRVSERRNGSPAFFARAAAQAISRNPVSLIVPCHRVIGKDGSLCGYAGGTDRKAALLKMENRHMQEYREKNTGIIF